MIEMAILWIVFTVGVWLLGYYHGYEKAWYEFHAKADKWGAYSLIRERTLLRNWRISDMVTIGNRKKSKPKTAP